MISDNLQRIRKELPSGVKLVAVSKFHPLPALIEAYLEGQRVFGENRPQEFAAKAVQLSQDIEWHFIGHLQTNKLKLVLPYAYMVESVDSVRLLDAIDTWGFLHSKTVRVLLELHLGAEVTKHGLSEDEIREILSAAVTPLPDGGQRYRNVRFCGLMGMATNTDDESVVRADFQRISSLMESLSAEFGVDSSPVLSDFRELSIGMSHDWRIAVEYGATIVRIGTDIFGNRQY